MQRHAPDVDNTTRLVSLDALILTRRRALVNKWTSAQRRVLVNKWTLAQRRVLVNKWPSAQRRVLVNKWPSAQRVLVNKWTSAQRPPKGRSAHRPMSNFFFLLEMLTATIDI